MGQIAQLFGGGNNSARKAQEAAQRQQLAQLARQQAEADQAAGTGPRRRAGALVNFLPATSLSGEGQSSLG
jgi:hypothetical protein